MEVINSRREFEAVKQQIEEIIKKGDLVDGIDNLPDEEFDKLQELTKLTGEYEKTSLKLNTLSGRSFVIIRIEEEIFNRRITQKEFAKYLGISETQLSEVINCKIQISMNLAIKLHELLEIDANLIIEHNMYLHLHKNNPKKPTTHREMKAKVKM